MKIYIAGKITGDTNYREKFEKAAQEIMKNTPGAVVLNPALLPLGLDEQDYMQITMAMLNAADAVYLLPDWKESEGARIEAAMCKKTGKPCAIISQMTNSR